jgi:cell division protein FtsQ
MRRLGEITLRHDDRLAPPSTGRTKERPAENRAAGKARKAPRRAAQRRPPRRPAPGWWSHGKKALAGLVAAALVLAPAVWLARSGRIARGASDIASIIVADSARVGLRVDQVTVQGRQRTARDDLLTALGIHRGDPILGLDLNRLRRQVESIPWVKTASLERDLPDELHVVITEREPIAIWQHESHYFLIDGDGLVIGEKIDDFANLPLIVGDGAPDHTADLIAMLKSEPDLAKRVKATQWISDRRWNVVIANDSDGIEVRLPEESPIDAWHQLAQLDHEHQLLERKISVIDMRLPDRLIVRVANGVTPPTAIPVPPKHKTVQGRDA